MLKIVDLHSHVFSVISFDVHSPTKSYSMLCPKNYLCNNTTNYSSFVILLIDQKVTMAVIPLIAASVAGKWEQIAYVLKIGDEVDTIKATYINPTKCFAAAIHKWISGSSGKVPKTWGTFTGVMTSLNINFGQSIEQKVSKVL